MWFLERFLVLAFVLYFSVIVWVRPEGHLQSRLAQAEVPLGTFRWGMACPVQCGVRHNNNNYIRYCIYFAFPCNHVAHKKNMCCLCWCWSNYISELQAEAWVWQLWGVSVAVAARAWHIATSYVFTPQVYLSVLLYFCMYNIQYMDVLLSLTHCLPTSYIFTHKSQ